MFKDLGFKRRLLGDVYRERLMSLTKIESS